MTRFQLIWYCLLSGQEQYCSRIVCSFVCLSLPCQNGFMRNEMVVDCVIGTIGETTFPGQTRPISTHHNEGVISAKASFFLQSWPFTFQENYAIGNIDPFLLRNILQGRVSVLGLPEAHQILLCRKSPAKRNRPWQDSNLQSPDPKSGALSIRPHGLTWVSLPSLCSYPTT